MSEAQIEVRVQPKAGRNLVVLAPGLRLKVYVTAAPERGKANDVAIALLSKRLGIAKSRVRIVRGHRSRNKVLLIEGVEARDLEALLEAKAP